MTSINIDNKNISLMIRNVDTHLGCFREMATKTIAFSRDYKNMQDFSKN